MIFLRRILFYLFLAAYLIICPLIILYAFGYILKPNSERGMIKTGLISLSSVPPGANVYIEDKHYLNKTPAVIRDLIPGNYSVTLSLKDFQSASRVVTVEGGKASVFEHTFLLPKRWDFQVLAADTFETLIPFPGTHFIILVKGSRLKDYMVYNWRRATYWPLAEKGLGLDNARVLSYAQARGSSFIFMHVVLGGKEMFIRFELKDRTAKMDELSRFFYKLPLSVKWDPADPANIFVLEDNYLNRIDVSGNGLSPRYIEGVSGYAILDRTIYLFGQNDTVKQIDYDKKKSEIVYTSSKDLGPDVELSGDHIIEPLSKEAAIFCPEKGALFLNLGTHKLLEKELGGMEFDPESKRLCVWQEGRIGILELLRQEAEEAAETFKPGLVWVFNEGHSIGSCFWAYKGTHIIFLDNDKVYLLGVEGELNPNLTQLFEVKKNSAIFFNPQESRLYFLDRVTGNFSCIQMTPEKEKNEIPFFAPGA